MDIMDRLRYARDRAAKAEEIETQRLTDADTVELQQAASVRLATRQAVREGFDDIIEGPDGSPGDAGTPSASEADGVADRPSDSTSDEGGAGPLEGDVDPIAAPEPSYAGAGTPAAASVQDDPGSQTDG